MASICGSMVEEIMPQEQRHAVFEGDGHHVVRSHCCLELRRDVGQDGVHECVLVRLA